MSSSAQQRIRQVSVIIPAYNAQLTIAACLAALAESTRRPQEIIVVSDGCTDATARVAEECGARVIAYSQQRGPAYARNVGAAAATGDLFFFVDADCAVRPDAIAKGAAAIESGQEIVFGSYSKRTRALGFLTRFKNLQHHYTHQHGDDDQTTFWSGCGCVTRAAFEDVGGFDVALLSCEDIEFGAAAVKRGYRIRLVREMQAEHLKEYGPLRLMRSDLFQRAIPWTQLIHSGRASMGALNTNVRGRLSVMATAVFLAGLAAAAFQPHAAWGPALAFATLLFANRGLLRLVVRELGWTSGLAAVGPLLVYYVICGVGFLLGRMTPKLPDSRTEAPQYSWVETSSASAYEAAAAKTSS